jgi:type IV pilus assembly protein PilA
MFCGRCGAAIPEGRLNCGKCGVLAVGTPNVPASPSQPLPMFPAERTSGKAIASLISGIFFFFFPTAILAIIFGYLSLSEIRASAGRIGGKGMAVTGLVLGYLGVSFIPILIIAAIAIPNLLRARIAANESAAASSVRTLATAEASYVSSHPEIGYTCSLSDLQDLIGQKLASGTRSGYVFVLSDCTSEATGGPNTKYKILSYPLTHGTTGVRTFCSDETAVIKVNAGESKENCFVDGKVVE